MLSMKRMILFALTILCISVGVRAEAPEVWSSLKKDVNFFMANDLGRNGYYDQKTIAELMGVMAEEIEPECVIAAGDTHHFDGVQSVDDPLWMTNYELIYSHPELMIDWLPALGNHEYRGNTQAVLDYSQVSRRWNMPGRYYTKVYEEDGTTVRFIILDTTPLIQKYRHDKEKYPDACEQDKYAQLHWLDSVLCKAKEDWVLVVGHHPIYAETSKNMSERVCMQNEVNGILLERDNVDMYLCGHIHNFQHIRHENNTIDYIVNSSASLSRPVKPIAGTHFCSSEPGFSIIAANKKELSLYMIDKNGNVLHTVNKHK